MILNSFNLGILRKARRIATVFDDNLQRAISFNDEDVCKRLGRINRHVITNFLSTKLLPYYVVVVSFFSDPFILLQAFYSNYRLVNVILLFGAFGLVLDKKISFRHIHKGDLLWLGTWCIAFLYMSIHGWYLDDRMQVIQSFGYLFKMVFLLVVIYAVKTNYRLMLDLFFKYNLFFMYASVLLFFLLAVGIDVPYTTFSQYQSGELRDVNYLYPLGIVNTQYHYGPFTFARIGGISDEPGQLALIIIFLLVLNDFTLKSGFYRKSLIFCGIFTFSLGYIFSVVLYAMYMLMTKLNRPITLFRNAIILLALLTVADFYIGEIPKQFVNRMILSRFTSTKNDVTYFAGDNRTQSILHNYNALKEEKRLLFGFGVTKGMEKRLTRNFAYYGFAHFIFMYLPIYLLLIKNCNKLRFFLLLIIVVNFIQRPGLFAVFKLMCLTLMYYAHLLKPSLNVLPVKASSRVPISLQPTCLQPY